MMFFLPGLQSRMVYTGVVSSGLTLQRSIDRLCDLVADTERRYREKEGNAR